MITAHMRRPGDPVRQAALGILIGSAALGVLSARSRTAARLFQLAAGVSVAYAGVLAHTGGRVMRDAREARAPSRGPLAPRDRATWQPFVTLIVPAKDEAAVIGDVVRDLVAQRYPAFEAIVVDDGSVDGTGAIAAAAAADGVAGRVRVIRREPGAGPATRGAALNFATPEARGEVLGAVDADSRLERDFVERSIGEWGRDPAAAAIQVQKRPLNPDASWLTRAQAEELLLDMSSQCGRWATGGTAELRGNGMFIRRDVLARLGGWGDEALTEDLDMSTRLAAAGERVAPAPGVAVREQALEELRPLWHQRMRWAEGSLRRFITHAPGVFRSPIPLVRKLDQAAFIVTESALPPFLAAAVLGQALSDAPRRTGWRVPISLSASYAAALVAFAWTGLRADGRQGWPLLAGALRGALFLAHWLLVVPAALVRIATRPSEIRYVKTPRLASRATTPSVAPYVVEEAPAP